MLEEVPLSLRKGAFFGVLSLFHFKSTQLRRVFAVNYYCSETA